ncbi:MAG: ROK family protein [Bryobacteraceae bacterium]|nr:ROK family protein [Bryobacteraceae bacterium]
MTEYSIGVDLGGTNLRAAAVSREGEVFEKLSGTTDLAEGRDAVINDMIESIEALKQTCGDRHLAGVGIGVPGFIQMDKGIIIGSNNLPEFENYPVRDVIESRLGTPIFLENDANAAALGEKWVGAGRDVQDLIMFTLGTGIGGGIISGGKILHGFTGMAGEVGHITVNPTGNPCGCGNFGCLEKHTSATAISAMAELIQLGKDLSAKEVYDLAVQGDPRAKMIFQTVGGYLGIALATMINLFNAPLYLLSGGVVAAWDQFAPPMLAEVEKRSFTFRKTKTRIDKAVLGNEAGLIGAAALPFQALTAGGR